MEYNDFDNEYTNYRNDFNEFEYQPGKYQNKPITKKTKKFHKTKENYDDEDDGYDQIYRNDFKKKKDSDDDDDYDIIYRNDFKQKEDSDESDDDYYENKNKIKKNKNNKYEYDNRNNYKNDYYDDNDNYYKKKNDDRNYNKEERITRTEVKKHHMNRKFNCNDDNDEDDNRNIFYYNYFNNYDRIQEKKELTEKKKKSEKKNKKTSKKQNDDYEDNSKNKKKYHHLNGYIYNSSKKNDNSRYRFSEVINAKLNYDFNENNRKESDYNNDDFPGLIENDNKKKEKEKKDKYKEYERKNYSDSDSNKEEKNNKKNERNNEDEDYEYDDGHRGSNYKLRFENKINKNERNNKNMKMVKYKTFNDHRKNFSSNINKKDNNIQNMKYYQEKKQKNNQNNYENKNIYNNQNNYNDDDSDDEEFVGVDIFSIKLDNNNKVKNNNNLNNYNTNDYKRTNNYNNSNNNYDKKNYYSNPTNNNNISINNNPNKLPISYIKKYMNNNNNNIKNNNTDNNQNNSNKENDNNNNNYNNIDINYIINNNPKKLPISYLLKYGNITNTSSNSNQNIKPNTNQNINSQNNNNNLNNNQPENIPETTINKTEITETKISKVEISEQKTEQKIPSIPKETPRPNKHKISKYDVINQDPSLKRYEWAIRNRCEHFKKKLNEIAKNENSILDFANSYKEMGVHINQNNDIIYKEYAPGAKAIALFGEFNNWKRDEYWAQKDNFGKWELILPNNNGQPKIQHNTKIKCNVILGDGNWMDRNPIWSNYLIQNKESLIYDSVFWNPEKQYKWNSQKHAKKPKSLRIYEAHVGMSSNEPKISNYREFANNIIPRIKNTGYTAIQLMGIMEHAYYGSFGYHVNNLFATSSRFGTPEDLKYLIDIAHQNDLFVILDIIHSHASSNVDDGFNYWDGTDFLYFHSGERGKHILWDSRLFNYGCYETLRLLLSNCAYYIQEFHFDGLRFDGVTSILYKNHGINYCFSGNYDEYFGENFDEDGGIYLMLANMLIHTLNPDAITIAEDVSGMPGLCRPIEEGGFGFDYRLNMSICDKWITYLKDYKDEDWNMGSLIHSLTNRRYNEKHIGYCESHDQSIVGDKTISMWLFDKEIYYNLSCGSPETIVVTRGMCLHKLIRMITFALGGEGYLCFMGNEFGHPEWVDFPREGNGFSYEHCRRRWDLCDNKGLRFKYLYNWDVAMNKLDDVFNFISSPYKYISTKHEYDKVIVFEKGDLLFVFNFHPYKSFENYKIGTQWGTEHKIILDSDDTRYFGKGRLQHGHHNAFPITHKPFNGRPNNFKVYIPSRTCMVLLAEENRAKYDLSKFTFKTID